MKRTITQGGKLQTDLGKGKAENAKHKEIDNGIKIVCCICVPFMCV